MRRLQTFKPRSHRMEPLACYLENAKTVIEAQAYRFERKGKSPCNSECIGVILCRLFDYSTGMISSTIRQIVRTIEAGYDVEPLKRALTP